MSTLKDKQAIWKGVMMKADYMWVPRKLLIKAKRFYPYRRSRDKESHTDMDSGEIKTR